MAETIDLTNADKATENALTALEKRLGRVYARAYNEANQTALEYFTNLPKRYRKEYEAYQNGAYTKAQFAAWFTSQIGRGERWKKVRDDIAEQAITANKQAVAIINDATPDVYALNANWSAYEIERRTSSMGVAFNVVSADAVRQAISKNHVNFKVKDGAEYRILGDPPRERDYNWNTEQVQNALMSGILQGKSIPNMVKDFDKIMTPKSYITEDLANVIRRNHLAAIRNARTAVTSAQNAGRMDTLKRAEDMGIEVEKEWMATGDSRTRDSHLQIDGEIVGKRDTFSNGLEYPGDPAGEPAEVYNCRCTILPYLPKYHSEKAHGKATESAFNEWLRRGGEEGNSQYYKDVNLNGSNFNQTDIKSIQERFKSLDKVWKANVSEIIDTNKYNEREYKLYFDNNVKKLREDNPRMRLSTAEKRAREVMGAEPEKASIFEGGLFFGEQSKILCLNSNALRINGTLADDSRYRLEYWQKQKERVANGRRERYIGNVGDSPEATFIHEYGHAVDYTYNITGDKRMIDLYEKYNNIGIGKSVSTYAETNIREFFAECFLEGYMPNSRAAGKEVLKLAEIIMKEKGDI